MDASSYLAALLQLELEIRTIDQVLAMTGERRAPNRRQLEMNRVECQRQIGHYERRLLPAGQVPLGAAALLDPVADADEQPAQVGQLLSLESLPVDE